MAFRHSSHLQPLLYDETVPWSAIHSLPPGWQSVCLVLLSTARPLESIVVWYSIALVPVFNAGSPQTQQILG